MTDDNSLNRLVAMLAEPDQREEAIRALTAVLDTLITQLADSNDTRRRLAEKALSGLGGHAVIPLVDALDHENSTIRGAAADLLGTIQDERAINPLLDVRRRDSSRWVRSRAQWALNQFPADKVETQDIPQLASPPETIRLVRSQAAGWPTLGNEAERPSVDSADMTAAQIRSLLDQLDLRLARGDISEETHRELYTRWEARLQEDDPGN